jgi:hypothetical protein
MASSLRHYVKITMLGNDQMLGGRIDQHPGKVNNQLLGGGSRSVGLAPGEKEFVSDFRAVTRNARARAKRPPTHGAGGPARAGTDATATSVTIPNRAGGAGREFVSHFLQFCRRAFCICLNSARVKSSSRKTEHRGQRHQLFAFRGTATLPMVFPESVARGRN